MSRKRRRRNKTSCVERKREGRNSALLFSTRDESIGGKAMDEVQRLKGMMEIYGIRARRVSLDEEAAIGASGEETAHGLFDNPDPRGSLNRVKKLFEENVLYVLKERWGLWHYFFLLPVTEGEEPQVMHIGPYLTDSAEQLAEIVSGQMELTESQRRQVADYFYSLPLISENRFLESLILFQMRYICDAEEIRVNHVVDFYGKPVCHTASVEELEQFAGERLAERYQQKEDLLEAITRGDRVGAYEALTKLCTYQPKQRRGCGNRMRSYKDMLLSENTLYREAAYRAAVHPMYIEQVFRRFAERIERAVFPEDLKGMAREMIRRYCLLVQHHSLAGYSQVVRDAINYIDCHFHENILLKDIAEVAGISVSYLAIRFKKETGQSVMEYINEKRVIDARKYLAVTDMPVAVVGEQVGIGNRNYFTKLFKKYEKCTPREYRDMMQAKHG